MGLRERKKRKTRQSISDIATRLFIARGYHAVTTAEIAERAEVSVPTLFKYFPTKEALLFDQDDETEKRIVETVRSRKKGESILDALLADGLAKLAEFDSDLRDDVLAFQGLVNKTPELSLYAQQMWMRHEHALSDIIRVEAKGSIEALEAAAVARFVLDAYHRSMSAVEPQATLRSLFSLLKRGWNG